MDFVSHLKQRTKYIIRMMLLGMKKKERFGALHVFFFFTLGGRFAYISSKASEKL